MPASRTATPRPVARALTSVGEDVATWRRLRRLTVTQIADRAGVSPRTVMSLEHGRGTSLENTMRILRALGVLDQLTDALDPYVTDVGRMRADEVLPQRVRHARPSSGSDDE